MSSSKLSSYSLSSLMSNTNAPLKGLASLKSPLLRTGTNFSLGIPSKISADMTEYSYPTPCFNFCAFSLYIGVNIQMTLYDSPIPLSMKFGMWLPGRKSHLSKMT